MNKSGIVAKVPKLRFPEFTKSDTVVFEKGDRLFDSISNKNHNSDLPILAITQEHGAIPRDQIDYNVSVTDKSLESYKVVEVGDFIISLRSFQGGIEYSQYRGICSPAYVILRKKKNIVEDYYKYYFKTDRFIHDLNKDIEGIRDGKMVSYNQFSALLLPNPEKKEQQKIADCLSSLDDLISLENKKLVAIKAHKTGLMRKLFPAEGKKLPEWRFPAFRGSGVWIENSVAELITTITPPKKLLTSDYMKEGNYPIIDQSQEDVCGWTNDQDALVSGKFPLLIFGDHTCVMKIAHQPFAQGADGIKIFSSKSCIEPRFLYQYLLFAPIKADGYNRHFSALKERSVFYPKKESGEQQQIAECLLSIDSLIKAQKKRIEYLKLFKKGLLIELFPSIQEINI